MRMKFLLAGSAVALGTALTATPASAGNVCEVNGTNTVLGAAPGTNALACGVAAIAGSTDSTAIGGNNPIVDADAVAGGTTVGSHTTVNSAGDLTPTIFVAVPAAPLAGTAIGSWSGVNGDNNVAVGAGALVGFNNGVTNTVVFGGTV